MDKICGWEDEKWVGSKCAASMWIYTKGVVTGWQKPTPEMEEHLKRTFVVHYGMYELGLCWNLRRSRVGCRKHNCPARRSDGRGIGLRKLWPVCVAMAHAVVLCFNTVKSNIGKCQDQLSFPAMQVTSSHVSIQFDSPAS